MRPFKSHKELDELLNFIILSMIDSSAAWRVDPDKRYFYFDLNNRTLSVRADKKSPVKINYQNVEYFLSYIRGRKIRKACKKLINNKIKHKLTAWATDLNTEFVKYYVKT